MRLACVVLAACGRLGFDPRGPLGDAHADAPTDAPGAARVIQHASGSVSFASSVDVPFTSNVDAGNLVLVGISTTDTNMISAPTDTQNNAFQELTGRVDAGAARLTTYLAPIASTGADTVTCAINMADNVHCHIYEVANVSMLKTAAGTNFAVGVTALTVTANTSPAHGFALAYFASNNVMSAFTAGPSYGDEETTVSSANDSAFSEVRVDAPAGMETATATATVSQNYGQVIVVMAPK